ncbi:unnamed protein product [Colias eurytheme]|nr:unnamed protein product [Colias eurytheme]
MTHQNHQTNGASLEDCHTNFFALTELHGIKWRKLVWGETSGGGDGEDGAAPLADPVISSYARCLAGDILCVWRRVPAPQPLDFDMAMPAPPPLSLRASKELWIFWYGEEPDLTGLVAPELMESRKSQLHFPLMLMSELYCRCITSRYAVNGETSYRSNNRYDQINITDTLIYQRQRDIDSVIFVILSINAEVDYGKRYMAVSASRTRIIPAPLAA